MTKPILEVKNLTVELGGEKIIDNLSFRVQPRETLIILGPNGAGKTTTVKSLVGGVRLNRGHVYILGHDISKDPIRARAFVGVMSELPGLFPELTVKQNLTLMGKLYGLKGFELKQRVEELIEFMGLKGFSNRKYSDLSKGLKRRTDLIAALIHDPEILILDEPTSGIDVMSRIMLTNKLNELLKKGKTIVLTTHNIPEAMEIASRVLVLAKGKSVAEGTPAELRNKVVSEQMLEVLLTRVSENFLEGIRKALNLERIEVRGCSVRFPVKNLTKALKVILDLSERESIGIVSVTSNPVSWDKILLRLAFAA